MGIDHLLHREIYPGPRASKKRVIKTLQGVDGNSKMGKVK